MHDLVCNTLATLEREHDCRLLFAVESGSRAWGFASPDSDYDVRFVYVHPLAWYLDLQEHRDTVERFYPNDIDCAGWELRKALRLFAGCNLSLFEWLGSPIVYLETGPVLEALRAHSRAYFNPQKAVHHYVGTARGIAKDHLHGDRVNIKKLFYIVRPLLAAAWIAERQTMPPVRFSELFAADLLPDAIREEVNLHLADKQITPEDGQTTISRDLRAWIDETFTHLPEHAHAIGPHTPPDWEPLNELFRQEIGAPEVG